MAAVIHETPHLYVPFFKVTKDEATGTLTDYWGEKLEKEDRIYFTAVKAHAAAHSKSQLQSLFYERLSPEQRTHYDEVKTYVTARNEAAAIYSHIKKQEASSVQMAPSTSVLTLDAFRTQQVQRDALALKVVESSDKYQEFFTLLNVKEDKLLDHAVAGELREKANAYADEQDVSKRADGAQELKRILTTPQDYRIVNEVFKERPGVDINRLTFDMAFYDKVKSGEISASLHPDDVYKPIQGYLKTSREAAQLWKSVHIKGQGNPDLKQDWEAALQARNENAKDIISNQPAFVVLGGMWEGLQQRVHLQATQDEGGVDKEHGFSFLSAEHVLEAARGHIAEIAKDLLGNPNARRSNKHALRFGSKGSFVVNLSGKKEGIWKDFESGEGGNMLHLIQREKSMNFKESISYLAEILHVTPLKDAEKIRTGSQVKPRSPQGMSLEESKDIAARLNAVSELHMKSHPLEGTVAAAYLQEERGIEGEYASDLRYLAKGTTFIYKDDRKTLNHACLAAFGRGQNGRLSSVQVIKLTETGKRALDAEGEKLNKIHYGIAKGSFVCVQEDSTQIRVFIAEGVETALSLKEAGLKGKIVASLGIHNMANYQGPEKEVILCGDNDDHKERSQTHTLLVKNQEAFQSRDKLVSIIKPAHPGDDFNDVLKKQGVQGVQEYLKPYLDPEKQKSRLPQSYDTPGLDHKLPAREVALEKEGGISQSTNLPSSSVGNTASLEIINDYIQTKLRDIKAYKGTSLAEHAHHELKDYLHALQKNEPLFEAIKEHNKELSRDIEQLFKEQQKELVHTLHRGRGFEL